MTNKDDDMPILAFVIIMIPLGIWWLLQQAGAWTVKLHQRLTGVYFNPFMFPAEKDDDV